MKNKIIIKSLLVFALMFTLSASIYASEVTGNLSSNGSNSNLTTGSIFGVVVSPVSSSGGGSGGNSSGGSVGSGGGSVLGISAQRSDLVASNIISNDGNAIEATPNKFAAASYTESPIESFEQIPVAEASTQYAAVAGTGISFGSWIWIILLALFVVTLVMYIYSRDARKNKIQRSIK